MWGRSRPASRPSVHGGWVRTACRSSRRRSSFFPSPIMPWSASTFCRTTCFQEPPDPGPWPWERIMAGPRAEAPGYRRAVPRPGRTGQVPIAQDSRLTSWRSSVSCRRVRPTRVSTSTTPTSGCLPASSPWPIGSARTKRGFRPTTAFQRRRPVARLTARWPTSAGQAVRSKQPAFPKRSRRDTTCASSPTACRRRPPNWGGRRGR